MWEWERRWSRWLLLSVIFMVLSMTCQLKITFLYIRKSLSFYWYFSFYCSVTVMIQVARKSCLISPEKNLCFTRFVKAHGICITWCLQHCNVSLCSVSPFYFFLISSGARKSSEGFLDKEKLAWKEASHPHFLMVTASFLLGTFRFPLPTWPIGCY